MFPTEFKNDATSVFTAHNAISFRTELSKEEVYAKMLEMGINEFLFPDRCTLYDHIYTDKRIISGTLAIHRNAQCCAFTKESSNFYIFPIGDKELKAVGLNGDDLLEWIKFLNEMNVGFEYAYLGKQVITNKSIFENAFYSAVNARCENNTAYWVVVPPFRKLTDYNNKTQFSYLHWIALRYLINASSSAIHESNFQLKSKCRLAYYNIPRITMYLHKTLGLPSLKAFLYAHIANPFYYYYCITGSDTMGLTISGVDYSALANKPCVNVTNAQFKKLMKVTSYLNKMNTVLTSNNLNSFRENKVKIRGLKNLDAPYDPNTLFGLFDSGDYKGFVKAINDSYKNLNESNNANKKSTNKVIKKVNQ